MLTAEARTFVDVLYEMCGPVMLTDQDWDAVLSLAEQLWAGDAVASAWARGMSGRRTG